MARTVESVHQFTHSPKYRLDKELTVVRCNDGTVYEFERPKDKPSPKLAKSHQPDGSLSHTSTRGRLPAAVKETAKTLLGGWEK
jgi:hypothetical protein